MSPQGEKILLLTKHLHFVQSCKISSGSSSTVSNTERKVLSFAGGGRKRRGFFRKSVKGGGIIQLCICAVPIHHTPRVGCWEGAPKGYWWQLVSLGGVRWGAAGRAGLLSRGPGGESLALAPSPLVFGRCELLPKPHAQVEEPSRGLFVSPLTFPFLERKGKVVAETPSGAGCQGEGGRRVPGGAEGWRAPYL